MPDTHSLLLFIAAGWLLNLTPGPDVLYIVSNALRSGARAGLLAGLGVTTGCCVHIFAAALGLGALLAASATAFGLLKWAGAAYLLWLGARMLLAKNHGGSAAAIGAARAAPAAPTVAAAPLSGVFVGGFCTNALNPKVALFFLAFVPQFIAPDADDKTLAFVLLGLLFNLNSIPVNALWALAASSLARRVAAVQRVMQWLDRLAGTLFIAFGLKLALSDRPPV